MDDTEMKIELSKIISRESMNTNREAKRKKDKICFLEKIFNEKLETIKAYMEDNNSSVERIY